MYPVHSPAHQNDIELRGPTDGVSPGGTLATQAKLEFLAQEVVLELPSDPSGSGPTVGRQDSAPNHAEGPECLALLSPSLPDQREEISSRKPGNGALYGLQGRPWSAETEETEIKLLDVIKRPGRVSGRTVWEAAGKCALSLSSPSGKG